VLRGSKISNAILTPNSGEWKLLEKLRKVTAEDIVNVTKKYFTDNNRTVIILEQPETGEGTK